MGDRKRSPALGRNLVAEARRSRFRELATSQACTFSITIDVVFSNAGLVSEPAARA